MSKNSLWEQYKESLRNKFVDVDKRVYINDKGYEVPDNTIAWYNYSDQGYDISEVVESLVGAQNRDWFNHVAFSMCLPLTIANQYGFVVKAVHDIELFWDGTDNPVEVKSEGFNNMESVQSYLNNFNHGILSVENKFILKTPPNVNILVTQPPNHYVDGLHFMNGVVEADNLRRSFTFNIRVTTPNKVIKIKKGEWLSGFITVPRFYVENFDLVPAKKLFSQELLENEKYHVDGLHWERRTHQRDGGDIGRVNDSGRRYFKGLHLNQKPYRNHQKRIKDKPSE
jgi:hypothetical protein